MKNKASVLKDIIHEINKMKEEEVVVDYVNLKEAMNTLKKQDGLRQTEVKKLKMENTKLNLEIGENTV